MIRNHEQWVYWVISDEDYKNDWSVLKIRKSAMILTHRAFMTVLAFLINLLSPRVQESLAAKLECRETHERIWVFLEQFLIVNLLDEILMKWFKKFGNIIGDSESRRNWEWWERRAIAINIFGLCALGFEEQPREETSRQADCTSKVAWSLVRKFASSKPKITTFYSPVKAPETQNIVWLLWIRELRCTMLSKGDSSSDTFDTLKGSKTPQATYRDREVQINEEAQVVHDLDLFVTVQFLDEKGSPAVPLLQKLCSKTRIFIWVENEETPQLAKMCGKTLSCIMDNSGLLFASRLSSYSSSWLSSTSRSTDQCNCSRELGTFSYPVTTRSDNHACGKPMLTDPDKQATGNREPATEMNKEDPTQGIPIWLQPFTVNLRGPGDTCARTFLCKREVRFGRWCF